MSLIFERKLLNKMKILTPEQMYQADIITIRNEKINSTDLMERAGTVLTDRILKVISKKQKISIFCGTGNNGGDGLVIGRLLLQYKYDVKIFVMKYSKKYSNDMLENYNRFFQLHKNNIKIIQNETDFPDLSDTDVIIDCIFGIGLNRSPESGIKNLIIHLNRKVALKIAVDIPSGLFANAPILDPDAVFRAHLVLTLQVPKLAFFLPDSASFFDSYEVLDIGLDSDFISEVNPLATVLTEALILKQYHPREKFGHKGTFGHAVIIGGSYGKIGAIILASKAAFRMGAGLVTAFIPKCGYEILQTSLPEAMVLTDENQEILSGIKLDFSPNSIAMGMGMGTSVKTMEAFRKFLASYKKPMIIDADGLNCVSKNPDLLETIPEYSILTPHPGELKRLIGMWNNDYEKIEKAKEFARKHKIVLIVKGAYTMIFSEDEIYINSTGNPGMGTAGSGDTLSGILAGLTAQGYAPKSAALLGVYIHGLAGDLATNHLGQESVMASDIISFLPEALRQIQKNNGA